MALTGTPYSGWPFPISVAYSSSNLLAIAGSIGSHGATNCNGAFIQSIANSPAQADRGQGVRTANKWAIPALPAAGWLGHRNCINSSVRYTAAIAADHPHATCIGTNDRHAAYVGPIELPLIRQWNSPDGRHCKYGWLVCGGCNSWLTSSFARGFQSVVSAATQKATANQSNKYV